MKQTLRIGHGIDVHPFAAGRKCVLGGVEIPHTRGLAGHSDADALIHALCDALLGALALPDIGHWFPSSDARYRDVASVRLLQEVMEKVRAAGYAVINVDITILAQEPKLAPHLAAMRRVLAPVLGVADDAIGIKATTTESLGFIGRCEGIEVHAVCLLGRAGG
jgi:2-C-methyl-D-erythritol 2,4-cyclodiphosphate synthase